MNATAPTFYRKKPKEYDIIDAKELETFEMVSKTPPIELIRRAK